jgi:hypothetical protein
MENDIGKMITKRVKTPEVVIQGERKKGERNPDAPNRRSCKCREEKVAVQVPDKTIVKNVHRIIVIDKTAS